MVIIEFFCRFIQSKTMKQKHLILIHIFFWVLAGSLNFAFIVFNKEAPPSYYLSMGIKTCFEALDFYLVYLILIPVFFSRQRLTKFFLAAFIYLILFIPIYLFANYFEPALQNLKAGVLPSKIQFISASYYSVLYAFLGGLFRLSIEGIKTNVQKSLLEKQNAKNELAFLRSQINPHFLYNVLNTIHSYINSNNPNAAKAVIRLSDIMRYMLSDATKELITLEQEVEYLNSYIELQSYRLEKPDYVRFQLDGEIRKTLIPPLILIPFVENAFKHGKKDVSEPGISIHLKVNSEKLVFSISNYLNPVQDSLSTQGDHIGIANASRRLKLLFPDRHTLKIDQTDDQYFVLLELDL